MRFRVFVVGFALLSLVGIAGVGVGLLILRELQTITHPQTDSDRPSEPEKARALLAQFLSEARAGAQLLHQASDPATYATDLLTKKRAVEKAIRMAELAAVVFRRPVLEALDRTGAVAEKLAALVQLFVRAGQRIVEVRLYEERRAEELIKQWYADVEQIAAEIDKLADEIAVSLGL